MNVRSHIKLAFYKRFDKFLITNLETSEYYKYTDTNQFSAFPPSKRPREVHGTDCQPSLVGEALEEEDGQKVVIEFLSTREADVRTLVKLAVQKWLKKFWQFPDH